MTPSHPPLTTTIGYLRAILTDVNEVARYRQLSPCETAALNYAHGVLGDYDLGMPVSPSDCATAFHNFVKDRITP